MNTHCIFQICDPIYLIFLATRVCGHPVGRHNTCQPYSSAGILQYFPQSMLSSQSVFVRRENSFQQIPSSSTHCNTKWLSGPREISCYVTPAIGHMNSELASDFIYVTTLGLTGTHGENWNYSRFHAFHRTGLRLWERRG